jgi:hypothetical protein
MAPGGHAGQDVWRQIFERFDSIRISAETCKIVEVDAYDVLTTSTVDPKGFYNGIIFGEGYQNIFDAGVFRYSSGEYGNAYVYVYSEYNSRRIRFQLNADEVGGTFNIYVKVVLVEDADDISGITQSISLKSGYSAPSLVPPVDDVSPSNAAYMTMGSTVTKFQSRVAPTITVHEGWTAYDAAPGQQLRWSSADPGDNFSLDTNNPTGSTNHFINNAFARIKAYADDNTQTSPLVADYIQLAITGVDASNLVAVNTAIDASDSASITTVAKIQEIVDAI